MEHTKNYLETRAAQRPKTGSIFKKAKLNLSEEEGKILRTAKNTIGTTAKRAVSPWAKFFFITLHNTVLFTHLMKKDGEKFKELKLLLHTFADERKKGTVKPHKPVYRFLAENCRDLNFPLDQLRDFSYGLKNVNVYANGYVSDKPFLTKFDTNVDNVTDIYICKLYMVVNDDGKQSCSGVAISPDCKPTLLSEGKNANKTPKTSTSKESKKSPEGKNQQSNLKSFLSKPSTPAADPKPDNKDDKIIHNPFDWKMLLQGKVNPHVLYHHFEPSLGLSTAESASYAQFLIAPRKLPYDLMKKLWSLVQSVESKTEADHFKAFSKQASQSLKLRYMVELSASNYENVIPGNGYCFYECMLFLMKKHSGVDVSKLFATNQSWTTDLRDELQKDLEFWSRKFEELKSSTHQQRNHYITIHFEHAVKALKLKLKNTISKLDEDITTASPKKPYLPKEHWAGTDIGSMVFAERVGFPVVGFKEASLQEHFITSIRDLHDLRQSNGFVELHSVTSESLRIALEDDNNDKRYGNAFPYTQTSVFRDQIFNIHALKNIFGTQPLGFATFQQHNNYLNIDCVQSLKFFDQAVLKIVQAIFDNVYPVLLKAHKEGVRRFISESEYDQLHDHYFVVDLLQPPAVASSSLMVPSSSSSSPPANTPTTLKGVSAKTQDNNSDDMIAMTPATRSLYVLEKSQVQELASSVYESLENTAFDSLEEMWNRFYKVLAQKVGYRGYTELR